MSTPQLPSLHPSPRATISLFSKSVSLCFLSSFVSSLIRFHIWDDVIWYFSSFWLNSLSMAVSRSIRVAANGIKLGSHLNFLFPYLKIFPPPLPLFLFEKGVSFLFLKLNSSICLLNCLSSHILLHEVTYFTKTVSSHLNGTFPSTNKQIKAFVWTLLRLRIFSHSFPGLCCSWPLT